MPIRTLAATLIALGGLAAAPLQAQPLPPRPGCVQDRAEARADRREAVRDAREAGRDYATATTPGQAREAARDYQDARRDAAEANRDRAAVAARPNC